MKLIQIIREIKQVRSELDIFKQLFIQKLYQEPAYGFKDPDDWMEEGWYEMFLNRIKNAQSIGEIQQLMLDHFSDDQEDEDRINRLINDTKQEINAK